MRDWFTRDLMPPGDFAGYVAVIEYVRDALLRHGRVPTWCSECFGGSTYFVSSFKEYAAFPLALWLDAVLATKLMCLIMKVLGGFGMYLLFARLLAAPAAGILAGYAYAFGTIANREYTLDVPVSGALFPLIFLASVEMLRLRRSWWAAALGILVACQLSNNWVQGVFCPVLFLLVLGLRPWRKTPADDNPFVDGELGRHWLWLAIIALLVFGAFALSPIAWLTFDSANHSLLPADAVAAQRDVLVERSPFLFVNRNNWMASWLAEHQPPGFHLTVFDGDRRYLGFVALGMCVAGWFVARRHYSMRRWYQVGLLLLALQYWMSLGPRTLLWEVARSFHLTDGTEAVIRGSLVIGAAACLCAATYLLVRSRIGTAAVAPFRIELLFGLALALFFPTQSLWEALRRGIPPLEAQRSPGHFFDLGHFSFYYVFGLSVVAVLGRLRASVRRAVFVLVAALLVVDFWSSTGAYSDGDALQPLREARQMVKAIPGEKGTLRLAPLPGGTVLGSWVSLNSEVGWEWNWLGWQAGRHWTEYRRSAWEFQLGARYDTADRRSALLQTARVKYALVDYEGAGEWMLPPPWERLARRRRFSLWAQPKVVPVAAGYRTFVLLVEEPDRHAAEVSAESFPRNAVTVSVDGSLSDVREGLLEAAAVVHWGQDAAVADQASKAVADRYAAKVHTRGEARETAWARFLRQAPQQPRLEVTHERRAPEHITLTLDAKSEPALVFLSEGYHPWWQATVDGVPTPVWRAQMAFMAVAVAPGSHTIDLRLERPWPVRSAERITRAAWLTVVVAGPLVAVLALCRRRRGQQSRRWPLPRSLSG